MNSNNTQANNNMAPNDKINGYFASLKSWQPVIVDKNSAFEAISAAHNYNKNSALLIAFVVLSLSLIFSFFSLRIAYNMLAASPFTPADAAYITASPLVEKAGNVIAAPNETIVSIISISFFSLAVLILCLIVLYTGCYLYAAVISPASKPKPLTL